MNRLARVVMGLSAAAGTFLAFAWPYVFGNDPGSEAFHLVAVTTLLVFLGSLSLVLATKR